MNAPPRWLNRLSKRRSRQGLYEFLTTEFRAIPDGARVLTVGSGGEVNRMLDELTHGRSVTIVSSDIDPDRRPDLVADICTDLLEPEAYDVIVMAEVLEHTHSPKDAMSNLLRGLRPGGRLLLTTPFLFPIHDRPYDYYRFTQYGLELLLQDFEQVVIRPRNSAYEAMDVLWLRIHKARGRRLNALAVLMYPLIFFVKRPLTVLLTRFFPADSMTTGYVASARKPMAERSVV